jgi:arylsulfatase A-like enzyme
MNEAPQNILLITTDQQRFDTINAAGNPHILTPNLNFLCDRGVRFARAYSDCPVCMPARTTILNGRDAGSFTAAAACQRRFMATGRNDYRRARHLSA